jgi:hypothetical protein
LEKKIDFCIALEFTPVTNFLQAQSLDMILMPKKLKIDIDDLVEIMDWSDDENQHYLDTETSEICPIESELLQALENDEPTDDLPEWMQESIPKAREIIGDDEKKYKFIVPFDTNESYRIMQDFVNSEIADEKLGGMLADTIRGRSAFRRFKDTIRQYPELQKKWFDYEHERKRELALEWLNSIGFEPE